MPIDEVKRVCFAGAGTMGCFNSLISAIAGYDVMIYDISKEALEQVERRQREWGPVLIEQGAIDQGMLEDGLTRVTRTSDPEEAAGNADFLSESVFERLELKRETHEQFDKLLPPHAIMTTNTSTLLLSDIESAVKRGDKFAAMHFHQPSSLVDILAGARTSAETIDIIKRFVRSQGQVYVLLKKEKEGYLHNAMYAALIMTAMMLVVAANADFQDVDRAWMISQNSQAGPFGMLDHVGLNVPMDILEGVAGRNDEKSEMAKKMSDFLRPYIDRGHLGLKTGRGFYAYPDPDFSKPEFFAGREENRDMSNIMLNSLISVALTLVIDGIADMEDVDKSWMLTHNPECGPFGMMDKKGLDVVKQELEERAKIMEQMAGNSGVVDETAKITSEFLDTYIKRGDLGVKTGRGFYSHPDPAFKKPGFLLGEK